MSKDDLLLGTGKKKTKVPKSYAPKVILNFILF